MVVLGRSAVGDREPVGGEEAKGPIPRSEGLRSCSSRECRGCPGCSGSAITACDRSRLRRSDRRYF
jgi:hypothetical protein